VDARGETQIGISPCAVFDSNEFEPAASRLLQYLIVVRGGIPGTMLKLVSRSSTVGRTSDNTFVLHDGTVSRRHAMIAVDSVGTVTITDLGSTNGTFIEGKRIKSHSPVTLADGSRIQFGTGLVMKYLQLDAHDEGFQRELFERSVRDNLTGLYNRGYFLNQIGPLAETNAMCDLGLALILLDIDRFKKINDDLGHHAGDAVLREVANVLRDSTRSDDLVARYGGEEFIIALPSCSWEQAIERAERIRTRLANRPLRVGNELLRVTASLGLSYAPAGRISNLMNLIAAADEALYEAKEAGRDRVIASRRMYGHSQGKTESVDGLAVMTSI
jgi:diguanylate cyclase (GGDEF)-like protein